MEHIERSLKAFEPPKDGEAEDWVSGQVIAILTIFGLVGVQAAFTKLEEAVEQHKHIQAMLRHGYRELMIMGLIAFIMFVIEKSGAIKNEEALGQFESVHIMLFLLAICFVLLVLALVLLSLHMSSYWEELERKYAWDEEAQRTLVKECADARRVLGIHIGAGSILASGASSPASSKATQAVSPSAAVPGAASGGGH